MHGGHCHIVHVRELCQQLRTFVSDFLTGGLQYNSAGILSGTTVTNANSGCSLYWTRQGDGRRRKGERRPKEQRRGQGRRKVQDWKRKGEQLFSDSISLSLFEVWSLGTSEPTVHGNQSMLSVFQLCHLHRLFRQAPTVSLHFLSARELCQHLSELAALNQYGVVTPLKCHATQTTWSGVSSPKALHCATVKKTRAGAHVIYTPRSDSRSCRNDGGYSALRILWM